jgi:hypothetical protein
VYKYFARFGELTMKTSNQISPQTRNNWLIDAGLFFAGISVALSGIYFLFLPIGGYRGGRNPTYGIQILFDRHTWDDLHTYAGVAIIAIAILHLSLHWSWVVNMTRRTFNKLTGRCGCMNARGRWNLILNLVVAFSFLLSALSGLYFLFFPGGGGQADPMLLLSRTTWDLIHTWTGVIWISAAILHFAIHWRWVTKVTGKLARRLALHPSAQPASLAGR